MPGCGTTVKEYGFLLREDKAYAGQAAQIARKAKGHHGTVDGTRDADKRAGDVIG